VGEEGNPYENPEKQEAGVAVFAEGSEDHMMEMTADGKSDKEKTHRRPAAVLMGDRG
jgi:hypothetical protein